MFKKGDFIRYKGAGKLARLEGTKGKWCVATVEDVYEEDDVTKLSVLPWHRTNESASFHNMRAMIEADDAHPIASHAEARRIFRNK